LRTGKADAESVPVKKQIKRFVLSALGSRKVRKARKMLDSKQAAESHTSGACFIGQYFSLKNFLMK